MTNRPIDIRVKARIIGLLKCIEYPEHNHEKIPKHIGRNHVIDNANI